MISILKLIMKGHSGHAIYSATPVHSTDQLDTVNSLHPNIHRLKSPPFMTICPETIVKLSSAEWGQWAIFQSWVSLSEIRGGVYEIFLSFGWSAFVLAWHINYDHIGFTGPISLTIFPSQLTISFSSYINSNEVIATKFCTCHDSTAFMACAKICSDLVARDWITAIWFFHQICIVI